MSSDLDAETPERLCAGVRCVAGRTISAAMACLESYPSSTGAASRRDPAPAGQCGCVREALDMLAPAVSDDAARSKCALSKIARSTRWREHFNFAEHDHPKQNQAIRRLVVALDTLEADHAAGAPKGCWTSASPCLAAIPLSASSRWSRRSACSWWRTNRPGSSPSRASAASARLRWRRRWRASARRRFTSADFGW